ncbi:hypothetical protein, partial [Paraburkholderia sp. Ac-20347]|uniref:hypothetical protein n=1 Tax=Paraburkholderia sp. Ac-20347 TaxID=2703892 RepID=UPI00197CCFA3
LAAAHRRDLRYRPAAAQVSMVYPPFFAGIASRYRSPHQRIPRAVALYEGAMHDATSYAIAHRHTISPDDLSRIANR